MSATNFNTRTATFRQLMGNGLTYSIPRFQRDYSWTEEQWEDLWADLLSTIKPDGEPAHYMGYLVLQTSDDKKYEVIDGQQRLTTLSLIILAVIKCLSQTISKGVNSSNNQKRSDQIRQAYIGYLDPVTLLSRSKLNLNRNNDNYFQTYLVPLTNLPQRGIKKSEQFLRQAFEWFFKKIEAYSRKEEDPGRTLALFVEAMSDRLFFTVINVDDQLNAYKVFETLNSRGVRLSSTDLVKNYLFSVLHQKDQHEVELKALEDRWENIVGKLGEESFPDFLRIHWNSRYPLIRQAALFKAVRNKVNDRASAFELLRDLEEDIEAYLLLTDPERKSSVYDWNLSTLELFSAVVPHSLLLSANRRFKSSETEWTKIVKACAIITFRYQVIGSLSPGEEESIMNQVAVDINKGKYKRASHVIAALRKIYPSDEAFRTAFAEKSFSTSNAKKKKVARYILCKIEEKISKRIPFDFSNDKFNLEHILPLNPGESWNSFSDKSVTQYAFRLGNMTLLRSDINREVGNSSFEQKSIAYSSSEFKLTRSIPEENTEWSADRIESRQNSMAKEAVAIWRIPALD